MNPYEGCESALAKVVMDCLARLSHSLQLSALIVRSDQAVGYPAWRCFEGVGAVITEFGGQASRTAVHAEDV